MLCAFDASPSAPEAVRAALAYCAENDVDLLLLGVTGTGRFDPAGPAAPGSLWRNRVVAATIANACEAAAGAGVRHAATTSGGDLRREAVIAAAAGAADLVFVAGSSRPPARLLRRRRSPGGTSVFRRRPAVRSLRRAA